VGSDRVQGLWVGWSSDRQWSNPYVAEFHPQGIGGVGCAGDQPRCSDRYAYPQTAVGAAWALKPLRTDSVSRGLFISLFTREKILLSVSVRPFFFKKLPFFER
jgi:hypothetical protein